MKVIKKIAAIMLAIMMVLGTCSVVSAEETGAEEKGTITINNAIAGQEYKIYKILDLESYDTTGGKNLYSYKPADDKWKTFFEAGAGKDYVTINDNGYVEWKAEAKADELAQKALAYATDVSNNITAAGTDTATATTVTFNNLGLGYYLVDSTAGTLCGLDTTNPNMTIQEKNGKPTVDKKINLDGHAAFTSLGEKNSVNLGDIVVFQTTINVQPGAKNYILHDKMDNDLTFGGIYGIHEVVALVNGSKEIALTIPAYCELVTTTTDECTFELKFTDKFYQEYANKINDGTLTKIYVRYTATVKDSAPINTAMKNKTWLTYGDNSTPSKESITNTYTYGIPVYKHTGTGETKQALAGAEFKLYTDKNCTDANVLKFTKKDNDKYRYDETAGNEILTSLNTGMINIEGIKEGTYYLKETKAPKGYNLLKDAIAITIDENGKITTGGTEVTQVDVKNNAGSLLPNTGGIGTTIFYIAGALLVLASGVVLIAKKRTDAK